MPCAHVDTPLFGDDADLAADLPARRESGVDVRVSHARPDRCDQLLSIGGCTLYIQSRQAADRETVHANFLSHMMTTVAARFGVSANYLA